MEPIAKSSERIQHDALEAAVRKAKSGCTSCSEGYLAVAQDHGATPSDIEAARLRMSLAAVSSPARRDGAERGSSGGRERIALATAAGVGVAALVEALTSVSGHAYAGAFGADSNTSPHAGGMPADFYIGKLGEGGGPAPPQPLPPGNGWSTPSAQATASNHVTGYWFMYGPGRSGGIGAYAWGYQQGQAAVQAWTNNLYCCMRNVFGDVEEAWDAHGNPIYGWDRTNQNDRASVINGFLDAVASTDAILCSGSRGRLSPGLYANVGSQGWIFSGFSPSRNFVFWGTGAYGGQPSCTGDTNGCQPCQSCDALTPVQSHWNGGAYRGCLAGNGIVIWHFWVDSCGCSGDWDYAFQTPSDIFIPIACASIQTNWRWCRKCQGLFFGGNPGSVCPAGGGHDGGISSNYGLQLGYAGAGGEQDNWRWCLKCQGMFFAGNGTSGGCPAGGEHDGSASGDYFLQFGPLPGGQDNWRWCWKCQGMFFGGNGGSVCPVVGAHDGSRSGDYALYSY